MNTQYFKTKAACTFFGAAGTTFIAAGQTQPTSAWGLSLLIIGSIVNGAIALRAFIANPSSDPLVPKL